MLALASWLQLKGKRDHKNSKLVMQRHGKRIENNTQHSSEEV